MDKNSTHIEDKFRDAFDNWEADFSPSEMQADWSSLSSKIAPPQAPAATQPFSKPFWGAGKMLGIAGSAAVLTTAAVILYNTYIYDAGKMPSATENIVAETTVPAEILPEASQSITLNNLPKEEIIPEEAPEAFLEKGIYGNDVPVKDQKNSIGTKDVKSPAAKNSNENNSQSAQQNAQMERGTDNNGIQNQQKTAPYILGKKDIVFSDSVICEGETVSVTFNGAFLPEAAVIEWGDGNMSPLKKHNKHTYNKHGKFRIRVADENKIIEKIITVTQLPLAGFANYECDRLKCKFRNTSKEAFNYVWNFGDGSPEVRDNHPEHQFNDTGRYLVRLAAYNTGGCVDSFVQVINISANKKPVIHNSFTPNGDGVNDKFNINITNETYYHLKIVDRNSQVVFETKDKNVSWNGQVNNQGSACAPGTYFYLLTYKYGLLDPVREEKGFLQLLR